jgi:glycosyltransferase involved in cell wall biosynthesis
LSATPSLTIGLPVYNGERYLALALDDLLAQEYADFHLLISDNASTDGTEEICRDYASRDSRIQIFRHEENRGGGWNYNYVFRRNQSPFFKWATHDDGHAPTYLSRCMETFETAPESVVLVYPRVALIGPDGEFRRAYDERLDLRESSAAARLGHLVRNIRMVNSLLGVIRAEALASTKLNQSVTGYDNLLLAELALRGQFWEVPERLFYRRIHPDAASQDKTMQGKLAWLSAGRKRDARFALTRRVVAHFEAIERAPLSRREKLLAVLNYVPAHAQARIRHRRHRLASLVRRRARSAVHSFRRAS